MFVIGYACIGVVFVTGEWVMRLVILAWWPMSDIAMFLVQKYRRQENGLPFTRVLNPSSEEVCQQLDAAPHFEDYQILSSHPVNTWDGTLISDLEFMRQLDERFDDHSFAIAEILIAMRDRNSDLPKPEVTVHQREIHLLNFESVARILSSSTIPQGNLLAMEDRLARCLYLSDHPGLKLKILYFWVVAMYRLHKHADLINIIDRLDNMMGRIDVTRTCHGECSTKEPQSSTQQAVSRDDWISLTTHVTMIHANLDHQIMSICWRSGTESCTACKMGCRIGCGKQPGSGSDVPVEVQDSAKKQVASIDGRSI